MSSVTHYAVYVQESGAAIYGTATTLRGRGWIFRSDDDTYFEVCAYNDPHLEVWGHCDLADAQLAADVVARYREAQAGRCAQCGLIGCRGDVTCGEEVGV
jgi:hypothetical protein